MRGAVRSGMLAAGVALALAALATPAAAAKGPPFEEPQGAAYGFVAASGNGVPGASVAERTAAYRKLRRAGVRAVRVDLDWLAVEPPGEPLRDYDFSERDREVRAIKRADLGVIGILAYGHPDYSSLGGAVAQTPAAGGAPPFGLGSARSYPPDDPRDFARYARATAKHYGDEVIAWEVWNEENEGWRFWAPREDPRAYGELLCATYPKLKAVDPRTPVAFGGLFFPAVAEQPGMSATTFLDTAYQANPELGQCYDVMAYHPYPYPFTAPELEVPVRGSVLAAADRMREVLERHGDADKPLWITEIGWPTNQRAYGVSEAKQAQYASRMQAASFAQGIPLLTWYTYGDEPDPSGANQEAAFGLFRADGTPKPSFFALRTFKRVFRGARFVRDLSDKLGMPAGEEMVGGRGFALRYRRPASRHGRSIHTTGIGRCAAARITAVWIAPESAVGAQGPAPEDGAAPRRLEVEVPVRERVVTVVDHLGEERELRAQGGVVTLEAGPGPLYVVDGGTCAFKIA